jgi:hypothetical protein
MIPVVFPFRSNRREALFFIFDPGAARRADNPRVMCRQLAQHTLMAVEVGSFRNKPASEKRRKPADRDISLQTGPAGTIFPGRLPQPFAISSRFQLTYPMTDEDERELQSELARLQQEHRDLDAAIDALHQSPAPDLLRLQRLKKRKLQLRDRIAFIEDQITPDIIA